MERNLILTILFIFILYNNAFSWELYDRVIAVVNEAPIIESEVDLKFSRLKKLKKVIKNKHTYEKSRILDKFIENSLVKQTAEKESIIVSDKKIDNHMHKIMKSMNIPSIKEFRKIIENKEKISFKEYREELRASLITEQVMSIAIGVSPPTSEDAREWYKKNMKKLGFQVNIKHILIKPKNRSFAEEKRVNKLISQLRKKIISGQPFDKIAKKYSEDTKSAKNGGNLGWVNISELDPYFAGQIAKMRKVGQLSQIIKSNYGYHIVKYFGKRDVPFNLVSNKILNLLYQQKMMEQFNKWIAARKRESEIRIYMENYEKG
ncbi:MAG: peptidylprolyl isomerase [Spirochaetota bacterium]|nr:peptidylprolyl isomerase [Spirochaetota bacterium]